MKIQPLLFVEILFRKTRKECHLINADGMIHDLRTMKKKINELDNEKDIGFSNGPVHSSRKSLADALGDDEADAVHDINHWRLDTFFKSFYFNFTSIFNTRYILLVPCS